MEERYELTKQRLLEVKTERLLMEPLSDYFNRVAEYLCNVFDYYERVSEGPLDEKEGALFLGRLYFFTREDNYRTSYLCPDYTVGKLGESGQLLSALATDLGCEILWAAEQREEYLLIFAELFLQVYGCYAAEAREDAPDYGRARDEARDAIYWFYHDYMEVFEEDAVREQVNPKENFYRNIVMTADLDDLSYLYCYGLNIGEDEIMLASFLRQMTAEEIQSMADTFTEGYRIGFVNTRKDISKKSAVAVHYPIGLERVVRASVLNFEKMGLYTTIVHDGYNSYTGLGLRRGAFSSARNRQLEYDHKDDKALYYDKSFVKRRLEVVKDAFEGEKENARLFGGPAVVEVFGEKKFEPKNHKANLKFSDEQNHLKVYEKNKVSALTDLYIPGEERSFTVISYPLPSIGTRFKEIFRKTVEINTLDYKKYQDIQQKIIDVLDQGVAVHVLGQNGNKTDITVQLHPLLDPAKETIFENCVADVNIPVGEVFTTPVLEGTNGVLFVSQVYLGDYTFKNLELHFVDGKVTDYRCSNFPTEAEGKKLIYENILFRHDTLPIGEFAIGTNTTAYRVGKDYGITDQYPILIAEKTGPHFAVGDTCYDRAEDVAVFNPDGKEIVARDNSFSILRKTDPDAAYFNCHTDITIPFEELKEIAVLCADGRRLSIIADGKFVVPGTEELNEPLGD